MKKIKMNAIQFAVLKMDSKDSLNGNLFINDQFVENISLVDTVDNWMGFEFEGQEYDINLYTNDETGEFDPAIYEVIDGETQTNQFKRVEVQIG